MNQDMKVGILVIIVVIFSLGFVLLVKPPIPKDEYDLVTTSDKKDVTEERRNTMGKFLDDDLSVEMMTVSDDSTRIQEKKTTQESKNTFLEVPSKGGIAKEVKPVTPESNLRSDNKTNELLTENKELTKPKQSVEKGSVLADKKVTEKPKDLAISNNTLKPEEPLSTTTEEDTMYTVKSGDTLSSISKAHYQDSNKHLIISNANGGISSSELKVGMKLLVPALKNISKYDLLAKKTEKTPMVDAGKTVIYKVKAGDTISSIGRKFFGENFSLTDFKKANPGKDLTKLKIGESVTIPAQNKKR